MTENEKLLNSITPRERDVLKLVAEGLCNKTIAKKLGISEGVVKVHVKHVLGKLGVHNRAHATAVYLNSIIKDQQMEMIGLTWLFMGA